MKRKTMLILVFVFSIILTYLPLSAEASDSHVHSYKPYSSSSIHPHPATVKCDCGDTITSYSLNRNCSTCCAGQKTATNTVQEEKVFFYVDGDNGAGALIPAVVTCTVEYNNLYNYPASSMTYSFPPFASFASSVISYADPILDGPNMICTSYTTVSYYTSGGSLLGSQSMSLNANSNSSPSNIAMIFTLNSKPKYTTTGATFVINAWTADHYNIPITTYFS